MNRAELIAFLRRHKYCVEASVAASGGPQAAVVGFAVSDGLELVFDTLATTRKMANLRTDARAALVVGWDEEQTVQLEGVADEPSGAELQRLKTIYFQTFPDGPERETWKDITYVRFRPTWARYSDFRPNGQIIEIGPQELHTIPSQTFFADRLRDALVALTPEHPEAIDALRALYTPDLTFRDPIQEIRGIEEFLSMNRRLIRRMRSLEWIVTSATQRGSDVFLEWSMRGVMKLGLPVRVDGMTHATLRDGRITTHRDYWDVGELLVSPVPGGQRLLRALRSPFA